MTIVASIEWIFVLLLGWLFMIAGVSVLDSQDLGDAGLYRIMSSWTYSLTNGLVVPLLLFPIAAIFMATLMLYRKPLMRLMYTALGVATAGWSIWWLHDGWWWIFVVAHIGLCLVLVWVPSSTAWYNDADR